MKNEPREENIKSERNSETLKSAIWKINLVKAQHKESATRK